MSGIIPSPRSVRTLLFLLYLHLVTAAPGPAVTEYFLGTRHRADPSAFESWVRSTNNNISYRTYGDTNGNYVANLTQSQADSISRLPFILFVLPHEHAHQPVWMHMPESTDPSMSRGSLEPREVSTILTDVPQFQFISNKRRGAFDKNWPYSRDDSEGRGTMLFIIDTGFNLDIEVRSAQLLHAHN